MPDIRVIASPAFKNKSVNPYNYLLYKNLEKLGAHVFEYSVVRLLFGKYDLWHLHWPENTLASKNVFRAIFELGFFMALLFWAKKIKRLRIVWTAHNLNSHEHYHPSLEKFFWQKYLPCIDAVIYLSKSSFQAATKKYPDLRDKPCKVTVHGHYLDVYDTKIEKAKARQLLGIAQDQVLILSLGKIREYKNIPKLIDVFRKIPGNNLVLYIAGKVTSADLGHQIRSKANKDSRIVLDIGYIENQKIQTLLRASDLMVLPYENILNSGSALLSLSFELPVIVPDIGGMRELLADLGADWVKVYDGQFDEGVLLDAIEWARNKKELTVNFPEKYSWSSIAGLTMKLYEEVV